MSIILGIDTASARFALALAEGGEVVQSFEQDAEQDHSRLLLRAIDDMVAGRKRDLAGVAVVQGPGSYAGLRVGIATAQGLGVALGIPVRGISTLQAVALATGLKDVTAIQPAGRGEFAAQEFRNGEPAGPLRSATADELRGMPLAGEGAGALGGLEVTPEARCRAALAALLDEIHDRTGDAAVVDAVYLREPAITPPRRRRPAVLRRS